MLPRTLKVGALCCLLKASHAVQSDYHILTHPHRPRADAQRHPKQKVVNKEARMQYT
eukprot:c3047_g1_i1 orf=209-379(-)